MEIRTAELIERGAALRRFALDSDFAVCRRIHRRYGPTYYFSTLLLPPHLRRRVHALYAFVRIPDEWVDNPGDLTASQQCAKLESWRAGLLRGVDGVRPEHPVLRAFCDVMLDVGISLDEPLHFLRAMEQDTWKQTYATYDEVRRYMRGSASAVGAMMCRILDAPDEPGVALAAAAMGEAMQLTNFIRDVREDAVRGRIYLPLDELDEHGVTPRDLLSGVTNDRTRSLLACQVRRARGLYAVADEGIVRLPEPARKAVTLSRVLYAKVLDRIERLDFDVFSRRISTSRAEKLAAAARVLASR